MSDTRFVYVIYIRTTPEKLWQALTTPGFIRQYWTGGPAKSEWEPGSPVLWESLATGEAADLGQVVLEADPGRRLSYTWHNYQWEWAHLFGWTEEEFAELVKEKISKVTFDIEPVDGAVKLTVTHDDFEPGSQMLEGISQGWPGILSGLKTLLETGEAPPWNKLP